jgi:hypothetical protein
MSIKQSVNSNPSNSLWISIPICRLLDRLLLFIRPIVEYVFGMHIGFAFGWLFGLVAGHYYVNHFEPVYLEDLNQFSFWNAVPNMFARCGALAGLMIGVIAIFIINSKLLNQNVAALYEQGITKPSKIAQLLDKNVGQIKRKMNTLVRAGKINRKANAPPN